MEKNPLNKGVITDNFAGIGPVTHAMVQARARELAVLAGHVPPQVRQSDYEQAKRELTGESDIDRQDAILDALATCECPILEVHISNVHRREAFRHHSYVSAVATAVMAGAGTHGYQLALRHVAYLVAQAH